METLIIDENKYMVLCTYCKSLGLKTGPESFEAQVCLKCKALSHTNIRVRVAQIAMRPLVLRQARGSIPGSAPAPQYY